MAAALIPLLGPLISEVLDRVVPDKNAARKAAEELQTKIVDIAAKEGSDQREINKTEAAHPSVFVAGWRPAIGWVCVTILATYYVPFAIISTVVWVIACWNAGGLVPRPELAMSDILGLLGSLLGVGTLRTVEKLKGVDTSHVAGKPAGR